MKEPIDYPFPLPFPSSEDVEVEVFPEVGAEAAIRGRFADAAERDKARSRRREHQVARVKEKAQRPDHDATQKCAILGCGKPTRAATSNGLDKRYCRNHADHYSRNGDPLKGTYEAKVLDPYRREALRWLRDHADDIYVANARQRVTGLMERAGRHEEAFSLRGLLPAGRAKAHWARLRKAEIAPEKIVASWLAVEMAIACDPQPVEKREFRRVQAAKVAHRLASGTHKKWEYPVKVGLHERPKVRVVEMHKYPESRGRVLRHIGEQLEGAVELLAERYMAGRQIEKRPLEQDEFALC